MKLILVTTVKICVTYLSVTLKSVTLLLTKCFSSTNIAQNDLSYSYRAVRGADITYITVTMYLPS